MRRVTCAILALLCLGGGAAVVRADRGSEPPGIAELYAGARLVPTLGEERARWTAATSGELSRTLRAMHGVVDARVHLAVPSAHGTALDAPRAAASASVLVTRRAGLPPIDEAAVRALVCGAVAGLAPEHVTVVQSEANAAPDAPRLVTLGPLRITAGSVGALKLLLGGALAGNAVLALALAALVAQRRRRASLP
jgi:type III secretion protein J